MLLRYWIQVKRFFEDYRADIIWGATAFFISLASFSLGYIAAKRDLPPQIVISNVAGVSQDGSFQPAASPSRATQGVFVASRNGRYYYLPNCSGVKRIKEENKIWFETREEAEARGLRPAANCPGLE